MKLKRSLPTSEYTLIPYVFIQAIRAYTKTMKRFKKQGATIVLLGLLSLGISHVHSADGPSKIPLTKQEQTWLAGHPSFTVSAFPLVPYIMREDETVTGYMPDLLRAISAKVNLTPQFSYHEIANQAFSAVQTGKTETAMGIIDTPERARHVTFSIETMPLNMAIFTRKNSPPLSNLQALTNKRIASYRGYAITALIKEQLPSAQLVMADDPVGMLQLVATGEADAALQELHTGQYMLRKYYINNLETMGFAKFKSLENLQGHSYVVHKDFPLLQSILDKGYRALTEQEKQQLWEKWFGKAVDKVITEITLTDEERAWLADHPIIRVGESSEFEPELIKGSDGSLTGITPDLYKLLGQKLGVQFEIVDDSWPEIIRRAAEKDIDLVALMNKTVATNRGLITIDSPIDFLVTAFARKDRQFEIVNDKDLEALRVAYFKEIVFIREYFQTRKDRITRIEADSPFDAIKMILHNKADVMIGFNHDSYMLLKNGIAEIEPIYVMQNLKPDNVTAVRPDAPLLASILSKAINSISHQELQQIITKWSWVPESQQAITKPQAEGLHLPQPISFDETGFLLQSLAAIFVAMAVVIAIVWVAQGRPKQLTIREILFLVSFVMAGLIVSIAAFISMLLEGEQRQANIESHKYDSVQLAHELKQSSDDLTRFARTFVVTGDPQYERFFQAVVAIRDGKQAHPKEFTQSYWDQVTGGVVELDQDGELYSIEQKMLELGLSDEEKAKLAEAKAESDELINLEDIAMYAVKGLFKDNRGKFTIEGEPDLEMARRLLHGKEYHAAKARIMKPIDQFFTLLQWRTTYELNLVRQHNQAIIHTITVLAVITIAFLAYVFFLFKRRIILPLAQLETGAQTIEGGDYSHIIKVSSEDEVGTLAAAFNSMARSVEEALQTRNSILDNAVVSIALLVDRRFAWINQQMVEMFGYPQQEVIGNTTEFLYANTDDFRLVGEQAPPILEQGKSYQGEFRFKRKDGIVIWGLISGKAIDPDDLSKGVIYIVADITERKQAEQALLITEERSRALLESAGEGIYGLDLKGYTTFVNPAASRMLGYSVEELTGKPMHAIVHYAYPDGTHYPREECPMYAAFTDGQIHRRSDEVLWRKDGSCFPVEYSSMPIRKEGKLAGAVVTFNDITQRKETERKMADAMEAAESANKAKSLFLANMSHELRTPLNAILGFSEVLAHDQDTNAEQQEMLAIINSSGEHLLSMINDVLDLSKIEAGRVEVEPSSFNLPEVLDDIGQMFKTRAECSGLGFTLQLDSGLTPSIKTDVGKLRQIIINLLGNAVKFTAEGGVCLRARTLQRSDDPGLLTLQLEVQDSGPGISIEQQERIFNPFAQITDSAASSKGTGLGLAITKSFVELMGGEIDVQSQPGEGALFRVKLPVLLSEGEQRAEDDKAGVHRSAMLSLVEGQPDWRILVVEDNIANRKLLSGLLSKVGFEIREAENGEEALTLFQQWRPHFIWMDMRMPVMDGYDATAKIRALPAGDEVKIVAITANAFKEQRATILDAGCDDVVLKPFQVQEIFDVMEQQLGVRYSQVKANQKEVPEPSVDMSDMLSSLSEELRESLDEAAHRLDIEATNKVIERVHNIDSAIAGKLQKLADSYRFSRIVELLQKK